MPPPRRRESALAPCRGATLAPACWDSAVGTRGCPFSPGAERPNASAPSRVCLPHSRTVPSPPWLPPSVCWPCWHTTSHQHGPTLLGDALGWPPRTSVSRMFAAEQAGKRLSQKTGCCRLQPRTQNAQALGRDGKQQPSSCLPCSSQCALGLKWCQQGCEHRCWRGTGPPAWVQRDKGQHWLSTASRSAVTLRRCQLCLTDNKRSATGNRVQRRGGGVPALPP